MNTWEQAYDELVAMKYDEITVDTVSPVISQVSPEGIQKIIGKLDQKSASDKRIFKKRTPDDAYAAVKRIEDSVEFSKQTGHYNPNDDAYNDAMVQSEFSAMRSMSSSSSAGFGSAPKGEQNEFENCFDKIISVIKTIQNS